MEVKLWLKETSQPIVYENVKNTYTKGDLFCIYLENEKVHKFPINNMTTAVEDYGTHIRNKADRPMGGPVCTKNPYPGEGKPPIHEHPVLDVAKKVYAEVPPHPSEERENIHALGGSGRRMTDNTSYIPSE